MATGTVSGIVQMWDPISSRALADPLPVTADPVASIAFDPTGQRFATTASQDGTVKLFSTSTLEQEGTTLITDNGATSSAIFGPHGNSLLVVNDLGDGFTFPTSPAAWEQRPAPSPDATSPARNGTYSCRDKATPGRARDPRLQTD